LILHSECFILPFFYNQPMLRLMCVTAHPDDEAGEFGGSLRVYSDRGVETCVICLTPGQAATHRGNAKSDQELIAIRRREFASSCEILGVSYGFVLDYPDGKLHRQDVYNVACELTRRVREFRPQVMLTFGTEGGVTGHTDHSMASLFATLAFQWAGRNNRFPEQLTNGVAPHRIDKLYYATANIGIPGKQPVTLAPASAVIEIGEHLETKFAAFRAHTSQAPLWPIFEQNMRQRGPREKFHLAASIHSGPTPSETDLFAGIEES
jgi:LmbE family N-acetylglucosaminyl deacetylase